MANNFFIILHLSKDNLEISLIINFNLQVNLSFHLKNLLLILNNFSF